MEPDEPTSRPGDLIDRLVRQDLDPLSQAELAGRIAVLEGEIARVRARMAQAADHRISADALFKS